MEAYQPPSAESEASEEGYRFRDQRTLHAVVGICLLGFALLALLGAGLQTWSFSLHHAPDSLERDAAIAHYLESFKLFDSCWTIWICACYVSFGVFLFRASRNAQALSRAAWGNESNWLLYTPGWTVGWFFIPVLQWYRPYSAVKELWLVSGLHSETKVPVYFRLWWGCWLVVPALRGINRGLSEMSPRPLAIPSEILLEVGAQVLLVVLAPLAWRVIHSIYTRQQSSAADLDLVPAKAAT